MGKFLVNGGTLKVDGDLEWYFNENLKDACKKLLESGEENLVVDFSSIRHISSDYMGLVAETSVQARKAGKTMRLVVPPRIAKVFRDTGFSEFVTIEVV